MNKSTILGGLSALVFGSALGGLAACSQTSTVKALSSAPGQLFCAIDTAGGGTIVAGLISTAAASALPGAGPIVVLATNATQAVVQQDCQLAAQAVGATGAIPVSPPAQSAPSVAIPPAPGTPTAPAST